MDPTSALFAHACLGMFSLAIGKDIDDLNVEGVSCRYKSILISNIKGDIARSSYPSSEIGYL